MRLPYALVNWLFFASIRIPVMALGLIVVPIALLLKADMESLPIWGNYEGVEEPFKNKLFTWYAIRNPAHNLFSFDMPQFKTYGEDELEGEGFQWRYRHSKWFDSFRCTWGDPRPKGKREFYIGWKLRDDDVLSFTFFQFRPF